MLDTSLLWAPFSVAYSSTGGFGSQPARDNAGPMLGVHVARVRFLSSGLRPTQDHHHQLVERKESNVCVYAILYFVSSAFSSRKFLDLSLESAAHTREIHGLYPG
jgi:hypothetical protein